jgi:hypothetical protein
VDLLENFGERSGYYWGINRIYQRVSGCRAEGETGGVRPNATEFHGRRGEGEPGEMTLGSVKIPIILNFIDSNRPCD